MTDRPSMPDNCTCDLLGWGSWAENTAFMVTLDDPACPVHNPDNDD